MNWSAIALLFHVLLQHHTNLLSLPLHATVADMTCFNVAELCPHHPANCMTSAWAPRLDPLGRSWKGIRHVTGAAQDELQCFSDRVPAIVRLDLQQHKVAIGFE